MNGQEKQHFQQRSRLEIMVCLLNRSSNGSRKTRLIYGCNLSLSQFNKYVAFLIDGELLTKNTTEAGAEIFRTSPKGLEFLRDYKRISSIIDKMRA